MDIILPANTQIPYDESKIKNPRTFTTQRDGQESIRFRIYQGERPIAADNEYIGEVILNLATTRPAGEVRVICIFKVDHDGILHVLAKDTSTDALPVEKTFDRFYRLSAQEVEQKLTEADIHRDEDNITNRIFQLNEEIIQLQRVINSESEYPLQKNLEDLQQAAQTRDITEAEELLAQIKSKIMTL